MILWSPCSTKWLRQRKLSCCESVTLLPDAGRFACLATDIFLPPVFRVSMKKGRVVILLAGRRAGKKAIIIKQVDEGKKNRKFGHALVAGVERAPRKVTRRMSDKKIKRASRVKPFVKYVNYTHLLATRFTVKEDFDFKNIVTEEALEAPEERKAMLKALKGKLEER